MKKFIRLHLLPMLLVFMMIIGTMTAGASAFAASGAYDLNGDKLVTIEDVTVLLNRIANGGDVIDFNGDKLMTIEDVTSLLNYIANPVVEETMEDVVNAAYELAENTAMEEAKTLTGKVTQINTSYDQTYDNVTVTIVVGDLSDKPVQCYRMKGETTETGKVDVSQIVVGDTITVTGTLKNYKGTVEFDQGCLCSDIIASDVGRALAHLNFAISAVPGDEADAPAVDDEYTNVSFTYDVRNADGAPAPVTIEDDVLTYGDTQDVLALTIVVTATDGTETLTKTFNVTLTPADHQETMEDIVNEAYNLAVNASLEEAKTLTGKITSVDTAYSSQYGNVTVTIVVGSLTDKPIQCYRMKNGETITAGEGVEVIKVGDTITVTGTLKNYKGTIEFDTGCLLDSVDEVYELSDADKAQGELDALAFPATAYPGDVVELPQTGATYSEVTLRWTASTEAPASAAVIENGAVEFQSVNEETVVTLTATAVCNNAVAEKSFTVTVQVRTLTGEEIVNKAYAELTQSGNAFDRAYTLTGVITTVNTAYSSQYGNVTVTIVVGDLTDKPIQCYRMKNGENITAGEGVEVIKVGDTITVTGTLKNYNGTIEFDTGCTLDLINEVYQITDLDVVNEELEALSLPNEVREETTLTLATNGANHPNLTFTWTCRGDGVSLSGNTATLTPGSEDLTVYLVATATYGEASNSRTFEIVLKAPSANGYVDDVLNNGNTYVGTNTSYKDWTADGASGAHYLGQSAGGNGAIQLRTTNSNSGIVAVKSNGTVVSVTVTFNTNTAKNRTVDIYGSKTAFTSPSQLYNNGLGEKIGSLVYDGETATVTFTLTTQYAFIGLRSNSGALYLDEVVIVWNTNGTQGGNDDDGGDEGGNEGGDTSATGNGGTDVLTVSETGVSGTNYSAWTYTFENGSGATYSGTSAAGNSSVQLRTKNSNEGIVTTKSGGKIVSVTLSFNSNTADARVVEVFGSNTAYTTPSDLYIEANRGTSLGTIAKTGETMTLTVTGDYAYVGIRSTNGALYLDSITFVWEAEA